MNLMMHHMALSMEGGAKSGGDPHWDNVASLLHFEGENNSKTIADEKSGNIWVADGAAVLSTNDPIMGSSSAQFDGSNSRVQCTNNGFAPSSNYWTAEAWFLINNTSDNVHLMGRWGDRAAYDRSWVLYSVGSTKSLQLSYSTDGFNQINAIVVNNVYTTGVPFFVTVERDNNMLYLYVNGSVVGSHSIGSANIHFRTNSVFWIGAGYTYYANLLGQADEFRFTDGVARYGGINFAPPTEPFPNYGV